MAYVRRVLDEEANPTVVVEAIEAQLDEWRVPAKSATGPRLSTLGRVRLMRNQAVTIVAGVRSENARLRRLVEEYERKEQDGKRKRP